MQAGVTRALETGGDYEAQYRVRWPDGTLHWVESRARVSRDADGGRPQMIGVTLDITEQKRLEETLAARVAERTVELESSERRFRAVFDSAFQMSILADLDGRMVLANRTALEAIRRACPQSPAARAMGGALVEWVAAEARRLSPEFPKAVAGESVRFRGHTRAPRRSAPGLRLLAEAGSSRRRRGCPDRSGGPGHYRPEADGGDVTPIAEARGAGPVDWERRARFQQSADGRDRESGPDATRGCTAILSCSDCWRVPCRGLIEVPP